MGTPKHTFPFDGCYQCFFPCLFCENCLVFGIGNPVTLWLCRGVGVLIVAIACIIGSNAASWWLVSCSVNGHHDGLRTWLY